MAWVEIMLPSARTLPAGKLTQNPIRTGERRCIVYVGDDSGITLAWDHPRTTFATDVHAILQHALAVRDAHQAGEVSAHGLAVARGHLINRLAERLDRPSRVPDVQRFAAHLTREFTAIWSFLFDPTIDATHWRAEHAIRPAVVTRKVWGGNRTWRGAH